MKESEKNEISANLLKILILLSDGKRRHTSELSELVELSRSIVRHALQRLVAMGYIQETIDINHSSNRHEFQINRSGKTFLTKSHKTKEASTALEPLRQISVAKWLRTMANEFLRMADDLEVYDE